MNGKKLSKKWLYTFIGIAFVALATCTAALYYKEYIIATGTGLVFGAQANVKPAFIPVHSIRFISAIWH